MKKAKIFILTALVLALVACSFSACDTDTTSSTVSKDTASSTASDDESKYVAQIPNVTYNDAEYLIYNFFNERCSAGYSHFGDPAELELEENVVNDAVLTRNYAVEDQLKIKIKEYSLIDNTRIPGTAYDSLVNIMSANSETIHLVLPSMYSAASLSENGYLENLLELKYLNNLSADWWDSYFVDEIQINNRLDFVTGDICLYSRTGLFVNFFNKELFNTYGLENPYQLVRDKQWTIDKLYELSKAMSQDLDSNGIIDYNDNYGFGGQNDTMTFWFYSFGGRIVSKDRDGNLSVTMYSERNNNYVQKLRDFMLDDDCYVNANDFFGLSFKLTPSEFIFDAFANNRSLFLNVDLVFIKDLGNIKADFGILPSPLYDENQENYLQVLNCWNSNPVCIPNNLSNEETEYASIVLEAIGAATKNIVTPAFYDTTLVSQKARDDDSIEMLDIIFNGIGADLAHVYNWAGVGFKLNELVSSPTLEFTSMYQSIEGQLKAAIDKTMEEYK